MENFGEVRAALASGEYASLEGILARTSWRTRRRLIAYILHALHQEGPGYPRIGFAKTAASWAPVEGRLPHAALVDEVVVGIYENNITFHPLHEIHKWRGLFNEVAAEYARKILTFPVEYRPNGRAVTSRVSLGLLATSCEVPYGENSIVSFGETRKWLLKPVSFHPHRGDWMLTPYSKSFPAHYLRRHGRLLEALLKGQAPSTVRHPLPLKKRRSHMWKVKWWLRAFQSMYGNEYMIPMTNLYISKLTERFAK